MFAAISSPGTRLCRNVGEPDEAKHRRNVWQWHHEAAPEMATLKANRIDPKLSPAQQAVAWARLVRIMRRASAGLVEFGGDNPEAKVISRCAYILELRPQPDHLRINYGQTLIPARLVRLYCAEPKSSDDSILGLHLATKPNGPDVQEEQNDSIDEAQGRADSWALIQVLEAAKRKDANE